MNELTIYHFMSDKLNFYCDIGNIIALRQRAKKLNIKVIVVEINETECITFDVCVIFFIGGGSDREQALA
ncbi:glutamine amidotransferase, partial [Staphylococcus aureus]|nr:glutamine amidotransferase [Staphylococcus aureus]